MMYILKKSKTRGFTLIEMMVSIALFSIVMVVVAGTYLNLLNLDRQAKATNDVSANLNFVMDTMARSIRTGTNYSCQGGTNCFPDPESTFNFTDDQGNTITYSLDTNANAITECFNSKGTSGCTATAITDPRITVDKLSFYVRGVDTGNGDAKEPSVVIVIHGSINVDPAHAPVTFDIQTSATQRQIDI